MIATHQTSVLIGIRIGIGWIIWRFIVTKNVLEKNAHSKNSDFNDFKTNSHFSAIQSSKWMKVEIKSLSNNVFVRLILRECIITTSFYGIKKALLKLMHHFILSFLSFSAKKWQISKLPPGKFFYLLNLKTALDGCNLTTSLRRKMQV